MILIWRIWPHCLSVPLLVSNAWIRGRIKGRERSTWGNAIVLQIRTACPRSLDPFYTVTYYIKWVKTSWQYCTNFGLLKDPLMVLIWNGNCEIGAQVRGSICYLICLRHLIRSRTVTNPFFYPKRPIFLHACAKSSEWPSYICTMVTTNLTTGPLTSWKE